MVNDTIVYPVEVRDYSDYYSHTTSGVYLEVPLPDEIENFTPNPVEDYRSEGDHHVYVTLVTTDSENYLRLDFEDVDTRHKLSLKFHEDRYPKYAVSIPSEFVEFDDRSPLYGVSPKFSVTAEFDKRDHCIRVYREENYSERLRILYGKERTPEIRSPSGIPLIPSGAAVADISLKSIGKQRFRIIPFIGFSQNIVNIMAKKEDSRTEYENMYMFSVEHLPEIIKNTNKVFSDIRIVINRIRDSSGENLENSKRIYENRFSKSRPAQNGIFIDLPKWGSVEIKIYSKFRTSSARLSFANYRDSGKDIWTITGSGGSIDQSGSEPIINVFQPVPDVIFEESDSHLYSSGVLSNRINARWSGTIDLVL